jgi:hypothetical protein
MPDDLESDIQATAEDIAADAAVLQQMETEKAKLDADDPRVLDLSTRAEQLARGLASKAVAERELVDEAARSADGPDTPGLEPEG